MRVVLYVAVALLSEAYDAGARVARPATPLWQVRTGPLDQAFFSADGNTVVTTEGKGDGKSVVVRLRSARTGQVRATIRGLPFALSALAISDDGRLVATATGVNSPRFGDIRNGPLQLWDGRSGKLIRTLRPQRKQQFIVYSLAFSGDGRTLASGGGDMLVRLWNVPTGRERRLIPFGGYVTALAISRDGRRLAAAGNARVSLRVWDLPTSKSLLATTLVGADSTTQSSDSLRSFTFSRSGRYLLTGSSLWNCDSRRRAFYFDSLLPERGTGFEAASLVGERSVLGFFSPVDQNAPRLWASVDISARHMRRGLKLDENVDWSGFSPDGRFLLGRVIQGNAFTILKCVPFVQDLRHFKAQR